MKIISKDLKIFFIALLIYSLGALIYGIYEYYHQKNSSIRTVDKLLLSTVASAENLLQLKLQNNITGKQPITSDQDFLLSLELQALADTMGVAYIYSTVMRDGEIAFISSNPEPSEINGEKEYASVFLTPYEDAPAALTRVFDTEQIAFSEYRDQWGSFRSVFFPLKDGSETTYVIGVDVSVSQLNTLIYSSILNAFLFSFILLLIASPLVYFYFTQLKRSYRQRVSKLTSNSLTGLPNQRCLEEKLSNSDNNYLLLIEIENFDRFSGVLGVSATDALVLRLVYSLKELKVSKIEFCEWYQLADARFALYSHYTFSSDEISNIIAAVFGTLNNSNFSLELEERVPLIIRMGAVKDQENALMFASMALDYAKQTNQSFVSYDPSLNLPKNAQKYIHTFNLLVHALKNNLMRVYYQPILDVSNGEIVKYEALVRMLNDDGEVISSPDEFMPIAYQSRLCHKLTKVVVSQVLSDLKSKPHIVSINLSVKDLFDHRTREHLVNKIRKSGLGEQIEFELLEQQLISNYAVASAYIKQLKSAVNAVGMDDLGKLYSNFDRLFSLPLDFVKIDGLIVEAIERDSDAKSIIEGVVSFAREKGIHVIAEHCSSQSICDMVVLLNVDLMQGFHIGLPSLEFQSDKY